MGCLQIFIIKKGMYSTTVDSRVNAMQKGTVLMAINGHIHTNHIEVAEDVLYLDMNATRNAWWQENGVLHYQNGQTYLYSDYDNKGQLLDTYPRNLNELSMSPCTWFTSDPLSAVVSVNSKGEIRIQGMESSWIYDICPEKGLSGTEPRVSSYRKQDDTSETDC